MLVFSGFMVSFGEIHASGKYSEHNIGLIFVFDRKLIINNTN